MNRRVVSSGLLAGVMALLWTAVFQNALPLRNALGYKEVPSEAALLSILDRELPETGLYLVPGHSPPDSLFRARYSRGPIFRIHSLRSGAGGAAHVLVSLLGILLAPLLPAWLLWRLCRIGEPGSLERTVTVSLFGVFLGLSCHIQLWGMELYPLSYSLFLTLNGVFMWIALGVVLALKITPETACAGGNYGDPA